MTNPQSNECSSAQNVADFAVVGTGLAGLSAALCLAQLGARGVVTGPRPLLDPDQQDLRTTAIFNGGITLLERLGVWSICADSAAPLKAIRLIDDTGRLFRAPETLFEASDVGESAFGYNIPNSALVAALLKAIETAAAVTFVPTSAVRAIEPGGDHVCLRLASPDNDGAGPNKKGLAKDREANADPNQEGGGARLIYAKLVAGADGRRSIARKAARIAPYGWDYDQAAVVCSFAHSRAHENVSTEFHRRNGPLTTVPLPGQWSSLVWVESKDQAAALSAMSTQEFRAELDNRLGGLLGKVGDLTKRAHFPLSGMAAKKLAANRIALIGEAAHIVPPIGAQGLNLGLRDGAMLAQCVADARLEQRDPGADETLNAYANARRGDVLSRTAAVDVLNRSLLSDLIPAQLLRGAGLHMLNGFAPLKRLVMREGIQPGRSLPRLMLPLAP